MCVCTRVCVCVCVFAAKYGIMGGHREILHLDQGHTRKKWTVCELHHCANSCKLHSFMKGCYEIAENYYAQNLSSFSCFKCDQFGHHSNEMCFPLPVGNQIVNILIYMILNIVLT